MHMAHRSGGGGGASAIYTFKLDAVESVALMLRLLFVNLCSRGASVLTILAVSRSEELTLSPYIFGRAAQDVGSRRGRR